MIPFNRPHMVGKELWYIAQAHAAGAAHERADVEFRVVVGLGEAVRREVEVRDVALFLALQRVELGVEHAERAEAADHLQHQHLLVHRGLVDHRAGDAPVAGKLAEGLDDRRVRDVGGVALQFVEVTPPLGRDVLRIGEIRLVQLLDERRVAAGGAGAELDRVRAENAELKRRLEELS